MTITHTSARRAKRKALVARDDADAMTLADERQTTDDDRRRRRTTEDGDDDARCVRRWETVGDGGTRGEARRGEARETSEKRRANAMRA